MNRRDFMKALGVLALAPASCMRLPSSGQVVNVVHAGLNAARVSEIIVPESAGALQQMVRDADVLSVAGGRHAMGGQQFCSGETLLDMTRLNRVLHFDPHVGTIEVEAGIQWPELFGYLANSRRPTEPAWSVIQKQTGADRLSIGGALAANIHGRGLQMKPFIDDVASFTLVNGSGERVSCSRKENSELFALVIGGYGLFGVVYSATLKLRLRHKVQRVVDIGESSATALLDLEALCSSG